MESWHAILISAGASALTGLIIYFLTRRERKIRRDAEFAEWVGEVNADRKSLRNAVESIRATIDDIFRILSGGAVTRKNPLQLTEFGKKISEDLDARRWSERLCRSGQLKNEIEGMSHHEIEKFCPAFVLTRLNPDDEERRAVEECARDNGVSISVVRRVLAIELRDQLLKPSS